MRCLIYSDLYHQFAVSTTIAEQIVKNRNQYEQIESSRQKHDFVTLETKIKVIHLMVKKKNASEVGRICKLTAKQQTIFFTNHEKWFNRKIPGPL